MLIQRAMRMLCAAMALGAVLGAAGCSSTPHRTPAQRQADSEIAAQVSSALRADPQIFARHIDVWAERGIVHLGGYVWTDTDLSRAKEIAGNVPGVKQVVDDLQLERDGIDNSPVSR